MTRYIMPARSQGKAFMQRTAAFLERDTHRWVFVSGLTPEVECDVRKWLLLRPAGYVHTTPALPSLARNDEALTKATGLNLHMSVYGWPFCLGDLDGVNEAEGGEA